MAGGDGTVNKVFAELAGHETLVTLIPLGTANNIADTLGLTAGSPEELIAAWPDFVLRPFDIGVAVAPWGRETLRRDGRVRTARRGVPARRGKRRAG